MPGAGGSASAGGPPAGVDGDLTERDLAQHWDGVEEADREEAFSFINHEVLECTARAPGQNTVDGVWVRRWKGDVVKSCCCGAGDRLVIIFVLVYVKFQPY